MNDTITGISTPLGTGAVSIIRVSGNDAIAIVNQIFDHDLTKKASHTITYGHIKDNNETIDEVLVTLMRSPKTYTREDVVEINCHGGIATTNKVLELLLANNARLAEPGEFTKRAFLNGRIDLNQASGVMDLIESKTNQARAIAMNRVNGKVSELIHQLREEIVAILANVEVNIDYPEYEDILEVTHEMIAQKMKEFKQKIITILEESENNKYIKEGIKAIIIGKPNVGKSSLLNRLLNEEKAIVTDIPGTTRDIVEGNIIIDGVLINIIDTAGIRDTKNLIENIGVAKTIKLIDEAELILLVFDNNKPLTKEDLTIINKTKAKKRIIIINKIDLKSKIEKTKLKDYVEISVKDNVGINTLKQKIKELFNLGKLQTSDFTYITNARETVLLKEALRISNNINKALKEKLPIDMIEIDLKRIWEILGEITGETYSDELIDQLFTKFCLGK